MYNNTLFKMRNCRILLSFYFFSLMLNGIVSSPLHPGIIVGMHNCTLIPEQQNLQFILDKLIEGKNHLIYIDVTVIWNSQPPAGLYPENMKWIFTIDNSGRHLLLLNDNFDAMSLGTLSYGIVKMPLRLEQKPKDCLGNMTATSAEKHLIFALLNLPTKSKDDEDNIVSPFYICTGSVYSNGKCCNITYSGDNLHCYDLQKDNYFSYFNWIVAILALLAFTHCIYLIPKSLYEEYESTYKVHETKFHLKLKVLKRQLFLKDENWSEVNHRSDPLLRDIFEQIGRKLTSAKEVNDGNVTETTNTYNLFVKLLSVNRKHYELVSEFETAEGLFIYLRKLISEIFFRCTLRNDDIFRPCCYGKPFKRCPCKNIQDAHCHDFYKAISKVFIIILCLVPIIVRIIACFKFNESQMGAYYIAYVVILLFLLYLYPFQPFTNEGENLIIKTLQIMHKTDSWERFKCFLTKIMSYKCWLGTIVVVFAFVIYFLCISLPLIHFTVVLSKLVGRPVCRERTYVTKMYSGMLLLWYSVLISVQCTVFYTECFTYLMLGLIFNYELLTDKVILIILILTYAYSCVHNVYQKISTFNQHVFKIIRDTKDSLYAKSLNENESKAIRLVCTDEEHDEQETKSVGIVIRKDGKAIICPSGLFIFYQFQGPERLSYMHLPESFLDQLASKRGYLTPGSKYIMLSKACKEIVFMLLAVLVVLTIVNGFVRANDISATLHTLVTVVTSVAVMKFQSIFFKANEYDIKDHDIYLKTLIKRHINEFKNTFEESKIDILECQLLDRFNSDHDMVVVVQEDESGNDVVQSCFLKLFHQTEPYTQQALMQGLTGIQSENVQRRSNDYGTFDA